MTLCKDRPTEVDNVCGLGADAHLAQIQHLLPRGLAWNRDPNSTHMRFWRSFAEVISFAEDQICSLLDEFHCFSASTTLDQWAEQYGLQPPAAIDLTDPCLKPEYRAGTGILTAQHQRDLCGRVTATGGGSCAYFASVAESLGWVVSCEDPDADGDYPVAGCMVAGCVQMGPPPQIIPASNSNLGFGQLAPCEYGRAVEHPAPEFWVDGSDRRLSSCAVPGSELGEDEDCFLVGYFDFAPRPRRLEATACAPAAEVKTYESCIAEGVWGGTACQDLSGSFAAYAGHRHHLTIRVDMNASAALQAETSPYESDWVAAGCFAAGDGCSPVRRLDPGDMIDFLREIVPAHVKLAIALE